MEVCTFTLWHWRHLRRVHITTSWPPVDWMRTIVDSWRFIGAEKCFSIEDRTDNFGQVIQHGKLFISTKVTEAIRRLQHVLSVIERKAFLGLCNIFWLFGLIFAHQAASLNCKIRNYQLFKSGWLTDLVIQALQVLLHRLLSQPIRSIPRRNGCYLLDIATRDKQFRLVILQEQLERAARPVGYWCWLLHKADQANGTTHIERFAVVWAALLLINYLQGSKFPIQPDIDALQWILNMMDVTQNLVRRRLRLPEFDFENCTGSVRTWGSAHIILLTYECNGLTSGREWFTGNNDSQSKVRGKEDRNGRKSLA